MALSLSTVWLLETNCFLMNVITHLVFRVSQWTQVITATQVPWPVPLEFHNSAPVAGARHWPGFFTPSSLFLRLYAGHLVAISPVRADLYTCILTPTITSLQSEAVFLCLEVPSTCIFQTASILTTQVIRINSLLLLCCLCCCLANISFETRVSVDCNILTL